ncbi:hypothetical protein D3C81_1087720 [compost metagenome]
MPHRVHDFPRFLVRDPFAVPGSTCKFSVQRAGRFDCHIRQAAGDKLDEPAIQLQGPVAQHANFNFNPGGTQQLDSFPGNQGIRILTSNHDTCHLLVHQPLCARGCQTMMTARLQCDVYRAAFGLGTGHVQGMHLRVRSPPLQVGTKSNQRPFLNDNGADDRIRPGLSQRPLRHV